MDVERGQATPDRDDTATMEWTVHPAAERPLRALIVAVVLLAAAALAARASGSLALGIAGLAFLLLSLRAFFLPRRYVLDDRGAGEQGPLSSRQRIAWDDVRCVSPGRFGVHLSPRLTDSRLLPDRGLFLRTRIGGPDRDAVAAFAASRVAPR